MIANSHQLGIDAVISIGGDGSQKIALELFKKGMKIVGVPKTIDNDLSATEVTFGFDTALVTATDAVDKIHTTAESHHRIMVVEVMGRDAGWIALEAGIAGGAHVILIPEIPFTVQKICEHVALRESYGKRFTIIVVAEGIKLSNIWLCITDRSLLLLNDQQPIKAVVADLHDALAEMERGATVELPIGRRVAGPVGSPAPGQPADRVGEFVSSLDPTFRAQELSFAAAQVAANIDLAAAAEQRTWLERVLGHQPEGLVGAFAAAQQRAAAHVERHSVWLHNSLRGAIGLGLAVFVADESGVQHSFWVVLGMLSVLRSNALNTGQNIVRGMLGTVIGFIVGALVVEAVGTQTGVLWALLPLAILVAGIAPAAISFAAGQAAFTLTIVILFNIVQPSGWRVGLLRVEDVALGCAVSLAVGLLFWPRGAGAALGRALSEAYADSAHYLVSAVQYGVGRCDASTSSRPVPDVEAQRAAAAARRLDDTYRNYLAERGAKRLSMAEVSGLVTGVAGLRLAGDAVLDLWRREGAESGGDRGAARRELLAAGDRLDAWYDALAVSLVREADVPEPLARDDGADGRLVDAVRHDLHGEDGRASATAVRVIWTGDHLDAARRLQSGLVGPARTAVRRRALTRLGNWRF